MLTKNDFCDYDTCVALKELGIPRRLVEYVIPEDRDRIHLWNAQKWLREEKGIVVLVHHLMTEDGDWEWEISYRYRSLDMYDSYEEALSEGIKEAVKILKEK